MNLDEPEAEQCLSTDVDIAESRHVVKDITDQQDRDTYDYVSQGDITSILNDTHLKIKTQTSSCVDRLRNDCAYVLQYFSGGLSYDEYKFAKANIKQLRNIYKRVYLTTEQCIRLEVNSLHNHQWGDITMRSTVAELNAAEAILDELDVDLKSMVTDGVCDITIPPVIFQTKRVLLSDLTRQCAIAGRRRYRYDADSVILNVRRELKSVYGFKLTRLPTQRRHNTDRPFRLIMPELMLSLLSQVKFSYDFEGDELPELPNIQELHDRNHKRQRNMLS
jgi:hypothetical protein